MKTIGIYNCYTGVPADAIPFFQACGYNTYQRWDLGWTIWPEKHAAYYGEMVEDMNRMRAAGFRVYILLNINMRQCPSGGREGYLDAGFAAADHGVNVFIYDWYWYDDRPFLEQCLNEGFLKARNHDRMRFYLMWANHDATNGWDRRLSDQPENVIWRGAVDRAQFERIGQRLIERYFCHPAYYTIAGKPVFMIYDLVNLVRGLGGVEATRDAFDWFRQAAVAAGLPGLHLQLTYWNPHALNLSGFDSGRGSAGPELVTRLGFDSLSHYQYVHFTNVDRDYATILQDVVREWERIGAEFSIPYFPHVSVRWDNNPRFQNFRPGIVKNNTPEQIRKALELARDYADRHPAQAPLITINSWNEWTETSYLQPDDLYGYGYLDAVRDVFGGCV
jgi:hypothetical protein